jgi:replicative DNA helicase
MNYIWKSQKDGFHEALHYLRGRSKGTVKSIKTPWSKFNEATIDGLEWNTINVLAGRPGSLKTLIKDQIIRNSFKLNPEQNFRVLEFQLEMLGRTSAVRDFVSVVGKTYKQVCSADGTLSESDIKLCYDYAMDQLKYPIDVIESAPTVEEFEKIVDQYMELHHYIEDIIDSSGVIEKRKQYRKVIITLDHSILVKKGLGEKDKQDTLHKLGECLTKLKKKYPIIFLILSQLNRNVDSQDRTEEGRPGNYPNDSDVFGSDALLMHTDFLVVFDRPGKRNIRIYGPEKFIIDDNSVLIMHFLKCRNAETVKSFFKAIWHKMEIVETPPPPAQQLRTR